MNAFVNWVAQYGSWIAIAMPIVLGVVTALVLALNAGRKKPNA